MKKLDTIIVGMGIAGFCYAEPLHQHKKTKQQHNNINRKYIVTIKNNYLTDLVVGACDYHHLEKKLKIILQKEDLTIFIF